MPPTFSTIKPNGVAVHLNMEQLEHLGSAVIKLINTSTRKEIEIDIIKYS